MEREYIKIKKASRIPDLSSLQRKLSDEFWKELIFNHLLTFYKNHSEIELIDKIRREKEKANPRPERVIAKHLRIELNKDLEFNLNGFSACGEMTNDEDVEGNYDITIIRSYWTNSFYFECKNLEDNSDSANKYVYYKRTPTIYDGGVYRYFNGKYAQNQNFGGMLGFVISGNVKSIKDRIFKKLENPKFDTSPDGDLKDIIDASIFDNEFTFNSIHNRNSKEFTLYHILFNFKYLSKKA